MRRAHRTAVTRRVSIFNTQPATPARRYMSEFCNCCNKTISLRAALRHRNGQGPRNVLAGQVRKLLYLDDAEDIWDKERFESRLEGHVKTVKVGHPRKRKRLSANWHQEKGDDRGAPDKENIPQDMGLHACSLNSNVDVVGNQVVLDVPNEDNNCQQGPNEAPALSNAIPSPQFPAGSFLPLFKDETHETLEQQEDDDVVELWDSSHSSHGTDSECESETESTLGSLDGGLEPLLTIGDEWRTEWVRDSEQQKIMHEPSI
jgi:hypothetical protein